jgi:hypothetical protein
VFAERVRTLGEGAATALMEAAGFARAGDSYALRGVDFNTVLAEGRAAGVVIPREVMAFLQRRRGVIERAVAGLESRLRREPPTSLPPAAAVSSAPVAAAVTANLASASVPEHHRDTARGTSTEVDVPALPVVPPLRSASPAVVAPLHGSSETVNVLLSVSQTQPTDGTSSSARSVSSGRSRSPRKGALSAAKLSPRSLVLVADGKLVSDGDLLLAVLERARLLSAFQEPTVLTAVSPSATPSRSGGRSVIRATGAASPRGTCA